MKEPLEQAQRYLIPCLRDFRETQPPQRKVIALADDGKKMLWWPFFIMYSPLGLNSSHASPPPYACAAVKAVQAKKRKAKGKAGKRPPDALKAKEKRWVGSIWNPNIVFICTVHSEEFGHG